MCKNSVLSLHFFDKSKTILKLKSLFKNYMHTKPQYSFSKVPSKTEIHSKDVRMEAWRNRIGISPGTVMKGSGSPLSQGLKR